jgi:hypothetical protein
MDDRVCTYCGQRGHRAHACPRRPVSLTAVLSQFSPSERITLIARRADGSGRYMVVTNDTPAEAAAVLEKEMKR